jgi:Chemotaxis protein histidine kinase and related kinases
MSTEASPPPSQVTPAASPARPTSRPTLSPEAEASAARFGADRWLGAFVALLAIAVAIYGSNLHGPLSTEVLVGLAVVLLPGLWLWSRVRADGLRTRRILADLADSHAKNSAQTASLAAAKSESDRIMETVQEGLFLVDEKGIIGDYHSRALLTIFRQDELAGSNFFNLLQRLLTEKMFNTTKDYFGLLFDPTKREKTVLKVNPLTEIEVNFSNPEGGFLSRHLGFTFRRIMEGDKVARVFVAVRDITKQVELEKKLRESEKHKERQLDILLGIVHVPPADIAAFAKLIETELDTINQTLRAEDFAKIGGTSIETLRGRLKTVFRSMHNIKGNAALLKLAYFQKAASDFETKIADLLDRPRLTGDDFLSIVIAEAAMRDDLCDLQDLREKLAGLRSFTPGAKTGIVDSPAAALAANLQQLVEDAARDLQKASALSIDQFAVHTVSFGRVELVRDVLIQLTRNALAHSIEPPAERAAAGKSPVAQITIRGLPPGPDGLSGLAFRDDGRGLALDAIRAKAVASGLLAADAAANATPEELARCIFAPGFSTAATADAHSGRGMGMDIIKSKIVDEAGGILEVHSTPGQFCEFRLYLPAHTPAAEPQLTTAA